jgi:hypothetical protein
MKGRVVVAPLKNGRQFFRTNAIEFVALVQQEFHSLPCCFWGGSLLATDLPERMLIEIDDAHECAVCVPQGGVGGFVLGALGAVDVESAHDRCAEDR